MRQLQQTKSRPLRLARRVLGFTFLGIGVLGAILPIIPGWPGFLVAIALLGRRDRTLRLTHLVGRRALRRLRHARGRRVRLLGHWLSAQYREMRRLLAPRLADMERMMGGAA